MKCCAGQHDTALLTEFSMETRAGLSICGQIDLFSPVVTQENCKKTPH